MPVGPWDAERSHRRPPLKRGDPDHGPCVAVHQLGDQREEVIGGGPRPHDFSGERRVGRQVADEYLESSDGDRIGKQVEAVVPKEVGLERSPVLG